MIKNMTYVLNVKDVISDAHNTFMRGTDEKDSEQELQLEDILRRDKAFTWSDEDIKEIASSSGEKGDHRVDLEGQGGNQSVDENKHQLRGKNNRKSL